MDTGSGPGLNLIGEKFLSAKSLLKYSHACKQNTV